MNTKAYHTEEHFTTRGFRERVQLLHQARRFMSIRVTTPYEVFEFEPIERMIGKHPKLGRGEFLAGKRSILSDLPFGSQIVVVYENA